jgi:N-acetyl-gamma-glutamyl-phosphate reductase
MNFQVMITTAIIGASGYSGAELLRLLSGRDDVHIERLIAHSSAGKPVSELYPAFNGRVHLEFESFDPAIGQQVDVAFVALPSGESMKVVSQLHSTQARIIDLSGDFRLQSVTKYEQYYKHNHSAPELLLNAVYGLPELNKRSISGAKLIANPGCYPTSAILPLIPALKHRLISPGGIVINSLSGISGAGRASSVEMSFSELNENIRAYKIGVHQHIPEIENVLSGIAESEVKISFVPHLVPLTRGIYTTIHAQLKESRAKEDIVESYAEFYKNSPFVRVRKEIPQIKDVLYTNYCDIYITVEERTNQLVLISVIDNLVKGAAGQAIQNMNIMFGLPQSKGL